MEDLRDLEFELQGRFFEVTLAGFLAGLFAKIRLPFKLGFQGI